MIYVSMVEIFPKARQSLELVYGEAKGYWVTTISFFIGIGIIALIDKLVSSFENPHEARDVRDIEKKLFCIPLLLVYQNQQEQY